jgi:hypothetical protein
VTASVVDETLLTVSVRETWTSLLDHFCRVLQGLMLTQMRPDLRA